MRWFSISTGHEMTSLMLANIENNQQTGAFKECLSHFLKTYCPTFEERKQFAEFSGIPDSRLYNWSRGANEPFGSSILKMKYLLEKFGYKITELDVLDRNVYTLGKHLAYEFCTNDSILKFLNISPTSLRRMLIGETTQIEKERLELIQLYNEEHKAKLEQYEQEKFAILPFGLNNLSKEKSEINGVLPAATAALSKISGSDTDEHSEVLKSFASLVEAMYPLANLIASDAYTSDERDKLRHLAGKWGIFRLKNLLVQLCGEVARQENRSDNGKDH